MRQREEDLKWGVHNTWYNSHVDIHCGQLGFMVDVNTHPHCLAKGILPWPFWFAAVLLSQALVPISPHHRRKSCCGCCCRGAVAAVNVLPGTMCAAASSMLLALGTDRHKLIQFGN